jgi:hypothetical protein
MYNTEKSKKLARKLNLVNKSSSQIKTKKKHGGHNRKMYDPLKLLKECL